MSGVKYWNSPACKLPQQFDRASQDEIDAIRSVAISAYNAGHKAGKANSDALASNELMSMCIRQAATIKRYIDKFGEI